MDKKFELTNETIVFRGRTLYRIKALKDFGDVKKGDLGGFVEKESNLSQEGNCWICDDAKVFDNAMVYGNAEIYGNAKIYNNAQVSGDAKVFSDAQVSGDAYIYDNVKVYGNAQIYGDTFIYGNARIYGNAEIYGNAQVFGRARVCGDVEIFDSAKVGDDAEVFDSAKVFSNAFVYGNAQVYGDARVYGYASVCGNAILKEDQMVCTGLCKVDLSKNLKQNIRCQTNLFPQKDYVIAYKQVRKNLTSIYSETFQYKIGEWVEVKDPDMSNRVCTTGLHFSNPNYWDTSVHGDTTYLMAKIMLDDIITVQGGKIRCKRAFILDKYEIED
jgi:carbonic anhydrase/acetyltransferase-like protein (isoleucine patch superfamily)